MIYKPKSLSDPILLFIKDDPVRPEIPLIFRLGERSEIFVLMQNDEPAAILCGAYCDAVPQSCDELYRAPNSPNTAVFYSIWSYKPGSAAPLLLCAVNDIKTNRPNIARFVTLSPKTAMARRFHMKNGATEYQENLDTVNYEYCIATI